MVSFSPLKLYSHTWVNQYSSEELRWTLGKDITHFLREVLFLFTFKINYFVFDHFRYPAVCINLGGILNSTFIPVLYEAVRLSTVSLILNISNISQIYFSVTLCQCFDNRCWIYFECLLFQIERENEHLEHNILIF